MRPYNATTQFTASKRQLAHMELLSSAADSISDSDIFENVIRSEQQWSLMPLHGILSTVRPAFYMQGNLAGRQGFPAWLGKFSTTRKNYRLLEDIRNHMQSKVFASLSEVRLQYLDNLKKPLSVPLLKQDPASGVESVINCLDEYGLSRDDWNSIFDICQFSCFPNPIASITSQTKTKFTRQYNKLHKTVTSTKKNTKEKIESLGENEEEDVEEAEEESQDPLFKEKKPKEKKPKKTAKPKKTKK